jgi:tetratricopeptide (TPR) repeat protein
MPLAASPKDDSQEEMQTKWEEAGQALQRNDLSTAEDILRELLKKYGDQRGLHAGLGEVYVQRNQRESALNEFAKEEELFPDNLGVYRIVATYYLWLRRDDGATEQFRKWIQLDPKNYDAYAGLSTVLYRQKKDSEVLQLWLQAEQQLPDKKQVKRALAYAYFANHQVDKGLPLLKQVLDADSKPLEYNSASYQLAEANVDLPQAKEWGSKALAGLYQESLGATTEDSALSNTAEIAATWDTLGWVYYKLGEYARAETYLHSAFNLSQDPVEGDHLAQTYQKQGKKPQAEHTYKLAYADAKQPLKSEIKERYQQLEGKGSDPEGSPVRLKRGPASNDFGAADELSRSRTTKISAKPATSGSATFTIIFSPDKIEDVKFVSGDERLKPMAAQIAASNLRAQFPDSTPARLTRRGVLMCGSIGCDFTLLLPGAVRDTESQP